MEDQVDRERGIRDKAQIERKAQTLADRDKTQRAKDIAGSRISKKPSSDSLSAP
jgi:hypothetical protein